MVLLFKTLFIHSFILKVTPKWYYFTFLKVRPKWYYFTFLKVTRKWYYFTCEARGYFAYGEVSANND